MAPPTETSQDRSISDQARNVCAGPLGAVYDFYIERPWLGRLVGRALWGADVSILYRSIAELREVDPGSTIIDVPCGGGIALRGLDPDRAVRFIAADLSPRMLERVERRAHDLSLERRVETAVADMIDLPFEDDMADLLISYSGLHMIDRPDLAIAEFRRCLKPGGRLVGATFLTGGSRRAESFFGLGARRGQPLPPARDDLLTWLAGCGFERATVGSETGFALFEGVKSEP